jgi:hypothetical protein
MDLVTADPGTCDGPFNHFRTCDTCAEESAEIHSASVSIEWWARAIADSASEARETKDEERREMLLAAIGGLAWAIETRAEMDITGDTLSEGAIEKRSARIGRTGPTLITPTP